MSTSINDKKSSNDIFVTDQVTGQFVLVAFGAKFSRVRITSLAKTQSRTNPNDAFAVAFFTFVQQRHVEKTLNTLIASQVKIREVVEKTLDPLIAFQVKIQKVTLNSLHPSHVQQPQQPINSSQTVPIDQILPSLPSFHKTRPETFKVENELRKMLSKMTDFPMNQFQGHLTFNELGIDSLMIMEIVSEINKVFHISIPQDQLQDLQTITSFCKYLVTNDNRQVSRNELEISQLQVILPALSFTLPSYLTVNQHINIKQKIEQPSSIARSSKSQEYDQHHSQVSRLASLLSSHLDYPASDFERSTNLTDRGLDSLLCMELMSDIKKIFDVSMDLSVLTDDSNFGHLADIFVGAITPLENTGTMDSSTVVFTLTSLSGFITPVTVLDGGIDEIHVLIKTTKASSSISFATDILASAPQEFEGIKSYFDKLADEYEFSDFYSKTYDTWF